MGRIRKGWELAKQSLTVVRQDGSLSAIVILGALATAFVALALFVPAAFFQSDNNNVVAAIFAAVGAYVATFVGTFFAVALAAAAGEVLDGKDATVASGIAVARRHIRAIAGWALVLTTVNLVLQALRERVGWLGDMLIGAVGVAWGLATFFVIPTLAVQDIGPIDAVKRSATLFRAKWGEQLVGTASIGILFFLLGFVPAIILVAIGVAISEAAVTITLIVIAVLIVVAATILGSAARSVFSVALYRHAIGDGATGPFSAGDLQAAVTQKRR